MLFAMAFVPSVGAQTEPGECIQLEAKVRAGTWQGSEIGAASRCPLTGPRILADRLVAGMPEDELRREELVRTTALLRDMRLFDAGRQVALSPERSVMDRLDAIRVVAGQVWPANAVIDAEYVRGSKMGQPARQTHGSYRLGTNPLPTDVAQQAARLFFELSRDVDPLIRLAGFRLRVAFAQLHPLVTPLPAESFVSFDARCTPRNDLLEITSVLDVQLTFQIQLGTRSISRVLGGIYDPEHPGVVKPARILVSAPRGPVILSFNGRQIASISDSELSGFRQKCSKSGK